MKTKFFTLWAIAAIIISAQYAQAKVRRVGYPGNKVAGTDYATLQNATDSSNVKDSIFVFPGTWSASINKRLVFEGYGSPQGDTALQVGLATSSITISIYPGADSTILEGLDGLYLYTARSSDNYSFLNGAENGGIVNNITVRRSHCSYIVLNDQPLTNWTITQCLINFIGNANGGSLTNIIVDNCIICGLELASYSWGPSGLSAGSGFFINNVFLASSYSNYGIGFEGTTPPQYIHDFNNATFIMQNNIFADSALYNIGGLTWQNNVSTHADIPLTNPGGSATNNKQNVSNSAIFVGYPIQGNYTKDARYVLAPGSPAKGAGVGGVDCGVFGGATPFKLDCLPALPAFFKLSAPSTNATANPYTITFSVRSNN